MGNGNARNGCSCVVTQCLLMLKSRPIIIKSRTRVCGLDYGLDHVPLYLFTSRPTFNRKARVHTDALARMVGLAALAQAACANVC